MCKEAQSLNDVAKGRTYRVLLAESGAMVRGSLLQLQNE